MAISNLDIFSCSVQRFFNLLSLSTHLGHCFPPTSRDGNRLHIGAQLISNHVICCIRTGRGRGIVTTLYVDQGFGCRQGQGILLFCETPGPVLGPHSHPIRWTPSALSQGAKRPGREADHSPPFNAEFKISGASPPFLAYVLAVCVGKIWLSLYQNFRLSIAVRCFGRLPVSEIIVGLNVGVSRLHVVVYPNFGKFSA